MKTLIHLITSVLVLSLVSCAGMYQASFNRGLIQAVLRNDTTGVMQNVNPQSASFPINGIPPIYYAASHGNPRIINLLHNNGASLQSRGPEGHSLAFAAAANGHTTVARELLSHGAGSGSDLSAGAAAHQQRVAAAKAQAQMLAAAFAWLFGGGGSSGGGSTEETCITCRAPGPLLDGRCSRCYGMAVQQFDNTYNH